MTAPLVPAARIVFSPDDRAAIQTARHDAAKSAQTRVAAILSYSYKTLARDVTAAQADTTGTFHTDFQKLLATVVEPQDVQRSTVEQPPAVAVRGDADQVLADKAGPEARAPLGQTRAVRVETDHHLAAAVDDGQRAVRGNGKPG